MKNFFFRVAKDRILAERLRDALASGVPPLLHRPVSPGQLFQRLAEVVNKRNEESATPTPAPQLIEQ